MVWDPGPMHKRETSTVRVSGPWTPNGSQGLRDRHLVLCEPWSLQAARLHTSRDTNTIEMKTVSTIIILSAYLYGYEYDRNEDRLDYNHTISMPLGT